MLVVREAYLTAEQIKNIGVEDILVSDTGRIRRKQSAEDAVKRIDQKPYFPLYKANDRNNPIAYYFTEEKVIIPMGLNELKQKIYDEWSYLDSVKEVDSDKAAAKYASASKEQTAHLQFYLNQFIQSDGTITEPAFRFLSTIDYLLFREGSKVEKYRMHIQRPEGFRGYLLPVWSHSLPVWSYALGDGKEPLDSWAKLYQRYGLVPNVEEILVWLQQDMSELKSAKLNEEQYKKLKEYYCKADFVRLGNKYYALSEHIFDDGRCWDVFEKAQPDADKIHCVFPDGEWLSAKAPSDVVDSGLIAIDFGTKNTVIVIANPAERSFYTLKSKNEHGEGNSLYPTVLKFCSLEKFLEDYKSAAGRPETRWETVSIDNAVHIGGSSDSSLGIFRSLKQWMMDPNERGAVLRQKDAPDQPVILSEYGSDKNSIDPIELYAYYLGLYINNNQDNKIFTRYRLSFSAVCSEQIKHKMRESFQRGLIKSLPESIINRSIDAVSVECTCSEPAAYAVCALACMGIPNQCQKYFFYGIFDFGGGTCDFNYGVLMLEKDQKLSKKKYKIKMLGDGGDPFLGGENLLELLAVQVFIEERKWFEEHGYKIARPRCYEGGYENFFSASFEAANNLECLVEQLRDKIWETCSQENEDKEVEISIAGLLPEKNDGKPVDKPEITLVRKSLEKLLLKRIYDGVSAFFTTLYQILEEQEKKSVPQLCVFLAGNSCRSKWVRITFEKYIKDDLDHNYVKKVYVCDPIGSPEFETYVPDDLWDEGQKEAMHERISRLRDLDGKTGVAYGVALYGDQIQIENICVKDYLMYYLGTSSFFDIELLKGAHSDRLAIGESVPFAASAVCNLYYTKVIPQNGVLSGTKPIILDNRNIPIKEHMTWYVRANSQTEISIFAVSDADPDPDKHDPKEERVIDLQTGQFILSVR